MLETRERERERSLSRLCSRSLLALSELSLSERARSPSHYCYHLANGRYV